MRLYLKNGRDAERKCTHIANSQSNLVKIRNFSARNFEKRRLDKLKICTKKKTPQAIMQYRLIARKSGLEKNFEKKITKIPTNEKKKKNVNKRGQ